MIFDKYTKEQLKIELSKAQAEYKAYAGKALKLDMSRGKPGPDQLDLSKKLINGKIDLNAGGDYRNYGSPEGIPEMRKLFAELLGSSADEVLVGDGSSLNIMYDTVQRAMQFGAGAGCSPWNAQEKIKFLCIVPGYDRHFAICELFGIEMINVPMKKNGPDMKLIEELVSSDGSIKGIWCVPKFSNPDGITYSDETVKRFAALKPAAPDFRIFWDNAYCVHELGNTEIKLLNILEECKKAGNPDMAYMFASTSKLTFAGSGVACFVSSVKNIAHMKKLLSIQTIGPNKVNQYLHFNFLKDINNIKAHMRKHARILRPKFNKVVEILKPLKNDGLAKFVVPKGGYFISVYVKNGTAKRVVELCGGAGVKLTPAGATYPYGRDPFDSNIRIAPTYPGVEELELAMKIFAVCVKVAALESII